MPIRCPAPAKINLALHITGKREDGYHMLESMVVFADVGEAVTVEINPESDTAISVVGEGQFGDLLPTDKHNIIWQAVQAFQAQWPDALKGACKVIVEKQIPVAAGLGGGSADAAATLLSLTKLASIDLQLPENAAKLRQIAAELGADVPMCVMSKNLIASGIGETLRPAPPLPPLDILLVNPGIGVSTPQIFGELKSHQNPPLDEVKGSNWKAWLQNQRNDLEPVAKAVAPEIRQVLDQITKQGAYLSRMSGSGATCFGLFEKTAACEKAAKQLKQANADWWCSATCSGDFSQRLDLSMEGKPDGRH